MVGVYSVLMCNGRESQVGSLEPGVEDCWTQLLHTSYLGTYLGTHLSTLQKRTPSSHKVLVGIINTMQCHV